MRHAALQPTLSKPPKLVFPLKPPQERTPVLPTEPQAPAARAASSNPFPQLQVWATLQPIVWLKILVLANGSKMGIHGTCGLSLYSLPVP